MVRAELARGNRQGEGDDGGDDAVVQSALHVEHSAYAHGDPLVVDHLCAQSGVRGCESRTHEAGHRPREIFEKPGGKQGAQDHRERKTDAEKPRGDADVSSELGDVDPGGVGEQQEGQRQLRDHVERGGLEIDGERPQSGFARTKPAIVKTSGPLMLARASTPETTAHPRTSNATTAKVASVIASPPSGRVSLAP